MTLGPTQPPIQWVPGDLYLEVKWPGREADHSPPSSAEVKECVDLYLHSPVRLHGVISCPCAPLTEHHAMKAYWGSVGTAPPIL
jgi:hypothetical protein